MKEFLEVFASRKFVLFAITIWMADMGWVYALLYKPDQLSTISTFLVTLLGAYGGTNIIDRHMANRPLPGGATLSPPPSALFAARRAKETSSGT